MIIKMRIGIPKVVYEFYITLEFSSNKQEDNHIKYAKIFTNLINLLKASYF